MDIMDIEQLYWQFDAAHHGTGEYTGMARSERDAFKLVVAHALAEKDREIAKWSEIVSLLIGTEHKFLKEAEKGKIAYHALMKQAVRLASLVLGHSGGSEVIHEVQQFLASPEVQAWRKQEEQK